MFNIFNFQQYDLVDETFTTRAAKPLTPTTAAGTSAPSADVVFGPDWQRGLRPDDSREPGHSVSDIKAREPNFGKPTRYQAPRSVRFGHQGDVLVVGKPTNHEPANRHHHARAAIALPLRVTGCS